MTQKKTDHHTTDPLPLSTSFGSNPLLTHLKNTSAQLTLAQSAIDQALAPPVNTCCRVQAISGDTLIITTAKSSWASHLRFLCDPILEALQAHPQTRHIHHIQIKVTPEIVALSAQKPRPWHRDSVSKNALAAITQASNHVKNDALKTALKNLANTLKRPRQPQQKQSAPPHDPQK